MRKKQQGFISPICRILPLGQLQPPNDFTEGKWNTRNLLLDDMIRKCLWKTIWDRPIVPLNVSV